MPGTTWMPDSRASVELASDGLSLASQVRQHPLPPPFFHKDIIPNELFCVAMQGYHSVALS